MKNAWIYAICGIVAAGALATGLIVSSNNRALAAEALARKARSAQRAQEAKTREAEAQVKVKQEETKAAEANKLAKAEERRAREAEREIEREKTKQADAQAKTAADEAKAKAEVAKAAASVAQKAAEEAAKAKAGQAKAEAEKQAKEAEADRAAAEKASQEIAAKTVKDALALEQLRKGEYEKLLAETKALKAELDERERTLRPPKTVQDLMMSEEGGDLFAEEEYDEAPAAGFTRKKKKAKRILPENDRTLSRETRRLSRAEREMREDLASAQTQVRSNLVARLEQRMQTAIAEDRIPDAEFYLKSIKGMYPDYIPPRPAAKKEGAGK